MILSAFTNTQNTAVELWRQYKTGSTNHNNVLVIFAVKNLGPFPQKMVKFNPGLSEISSTVFSSKNMQLEVTKFCWASTTRYSNDNTKCYPKQCLGM